MKRISFLNYALVCILFMCAVACDKENPIVEDSIPAIVESSFLNRYPTADISTFRKYSEMISSRKLWQIDFTDNGQNTATTWYQEDGKWKMTHTKLRKIDDLSTEAQQSFMHSMYGTAQIKEIYKTERDGMENILYTLYFQFSTKIAGNVEHYIFLNDDGLFLTKFTWTPNDPVNFVSLPKDHFDFISEKYKGAEMRGYVNNTGIHEYFILHEGSIKYVFFGGEIATERDFWKETRYELSRDTKIPDNVAQHLKRTDLDFTYTNLYYIEAKQGNGYLFVDMNHDQELGYYIGEDILNH